MAEVIKFNDSLDVFQNLLVLYRNQEGKLYIGNAYYYNGRGTLDYMCVMCSEALPENMGILMGWNWLDDNSPKVTLVPEESMETSVEDFMYGNGIEKDWKSVDYNVIKEWPEVEKMIKENPIEKGQVVAYGILK